MFTPQNTRAIFINLDDSIHRRAQVEQELQQLAPIFGKASRFSAIRHTEGWRGCARSHVVVLQSALPPEIEYVAVFEDDFALRCSPAKALRVLQAVRTPFDVLVLAYPAWMCDERELELVAGDPHVVRLKDHGYWTTGYIVHRAFMQTLCNLWAQETGAIDKTWQVLQGMHRFYCVAPVLGNQSLDQPSTIQPSEYRRFKNNMIDPSIALVFVEAPHKSSMDLARHIFHHCFIATRASAPHTQFDNCMRRISMI